MSKGLIYLIQPAELVETDRYKIGMSNNPNLDRCKNGYKKGSRYICIMECDEPLILERNIKKQFNKKAANHWCCFFYYRFYFTTSCIDSLKMGNYQTFEVLETFEVFLEES